MSINPAKPSEAFLSWIESQLASLLPGDRLPPDRHLAKKWDLSERTIRRILSSFSEQGKLLRLQGKGTFIPGEAVKEPIAPAVPSTASDMIAFRFQELIAGGELKIGDMLPQIKLVCLSHHVNSGTVIAAYRQLVAKEIVSKVGKRYMVGKFGSVLYRAPRKRAVFLVGGNGSLKSMLADPSRRAYYLRIERELLRNGYSLCCHEYPEISSLADAWAKGSDIPQGIIVDWLNNKRYAEVMPKIKNVIARARPHTPSVVVLTESSLRPPAGVLQLCGGNISTHLARRVAQYAFDKHMHGVAFFLDIDVSTRLSVVALAKVIPELLHLSPQADYRIVIISKKHGSSPQAYFDELYKNYKMENIDRILSKYVPIRFVDIIDKFLIVPTLEHGCSRTAAMSGWFFVQDTICAQGLKYARAHGLRVPGNISVLSLENSDDYLHLGISCCVVDWETIGYQVAHAIIGDVPVARTHRGFVQASTLLLERSTTD